MERYVELTPDICHLALLGRKDITVLIDCVNAGFEPVLIIVDEVTGCESQILVITVSLEYVCTWTESLVAVAPTLIFIHQFSRRNE